MTAQFIRSSEGSVGIEYGHFFVESRGLREPPRPAFADSDRIITVTDNAMALRVACDFTRRAFVQLELWDAEPGIAFLEGAELDEGTVVFTDPTIHARAVMAPAPESEPLDLGTAGACRARVVRWGGADVERVFRAYPEASVHRVEHFVVQLWPTGEQVERPPVAAADALDGHNRQLREWLADNSG